MSVELNANAYSTREFPAGWQRLRLGEVCKINPPRDGNLKRASDLPTSFVPMAAVDEKLGIIVRPEIRPFAEVQKGYTFFLEGDVLFAKITPCMQNGKHAIARDLRDGIGFGTTEFHVLRPTSVIIPEWVHYFIRQPAILRAATAYFTGAVGQQRVPETYLSDLEISLPPLSEQKRIAGILNEQMAAVERARDAAEVQLEAANALPAAYLRAVFNSPEAQRWPRKALGEVGQIVSGVTLGRKINTSKTRSVSYLRVANVKDGRLDLSDVYQIEATEEEIQKLKLQLGDLLLTEGGDPDKLGRGTYWAQEIPECIHQNHIFRVRFNLEEFSPQFISAQIASPYGKSYFLSHAKQTTGIATINQRVLAALPLMLPPLSEQQLIVARLSDQIAAAEQSRKALEEQLATINKLPAALLRRAFSGEL